MQSRAVKLNINQKYSKLIGIPRMIFYRGLINYKFPTLSQYTKLQIKEWSRHAWIMYNYFSQNLSQEISPHGSDNLVYDDLRGVELVALEPRPELPCAADAKGRRTTAASRPKLLAFAAASAAPAEEEEEDDDVDADWVCGGL